MEILEKILRSEYYGNTVQAYAVTLCTIIFTLLVAYLVNRYLRKALTDWADKTNTRIDDFVLNKLFPPIVYIIIIIGLAVAKENLFLAATVGEWIDRVLFAVGLAVFFLLLVRFSKGLVDVAANAYVHRLEQSKPEDLEAQVKTVGRIKKQISEILQMILVILAILTILSNLGVDLKAIWASLGIGGIALVVAVKEPLTNLVGRMYIYSTGIFDEGHFIGFGGYWGTVKRISVFRTYLEIFSDMTTVSIPNADFIKGAVQNYYGRTRFMYKWDLPVAYDVPADRVQELVIKLREQIYARPEINRDSSWIYLARLDTYAKVVRVWFQAVLPDWATSLYYGNRVLHDIQILYESMGLEFALPAQTLHLKPLPGPEGPAGGEPLPGVLPDASE